MNANTCLCFTWNPLGYFCQHLRLSIPDQEEPLQGTGNRNRILPQPSPYLLDLLDISATNPKNSLTCRNALGVGTAHKFVELTQCTRTNEIQWCNLFSKLLILADQHSRIRKAKLAYDLGQECSLFDV